MEEFRTSVMLRKYIYPCDCRSSRETFNNNNICSEVLSSRFPFLFSSRLNIIPPLETQSLFCEGYYYTIVIIVSVHRRITVKVISHAMGSSISIVILLVY